MAVNKVDINGKTVLDLTGDSVTPDTLLQGATAHNAAGEEIEGSVVTTPASDTTPLKDGTASPGTEEAWSRGDHVHPSQILICTITGSGTDASPYACDKTTTEIWNAVQAGQQVIAKNATMMYSLVGSQGPQIAVFVGITMGKMVSQFSVMFNGSVVRTSYRIPTPSDKTDAMTQSVGMDSSGKLYTGDWTNESKRSNFNQSGQSVTSYPTEAGIYRVIGTNIFANMTPASLYGTLVIFRSTYGMHIYIDSYGGFYTGNGGGDSGLVEPSTWQKLDGVVEEGTSGIWTYKKYRNGFMELWGSKSYTGNASTSWGSLYALPCTADDYPIEFTDYPNVQREVLLNSSNSCFLVPWNAASKTNCGRFALVRTSNVAVNATVKFYVTGHWK